MVLDPPCVHPAFARTHYRGPRHQQTHLVYTEFCVAQIKSIISPVSINFVNPVIADHSIDFTTADMGVGQNIQDAHTP